MPISQTEGYFENPYYRFIKEPMLFLVGFKKKNKTLCCVKTKTYSNFAAKVTERNICTLYVTMECIEPN